MSDVLSDDQKIALFKRMAQAWHEKDWATCADLFAPDGVLHSMMLEPVVGRQTIYERICKLGENPKKKVTLHIHRIGVIGDALFVERTDEIVIGDHRGQAPVVGVITFKQGRIALWREYYDRAQLMRAAGHTTDPHAS